MAEPQFTEAQLSQYLEMKVADGSMTPEQASKVSSDHQMSLMPKGTLGSAIWEPTKAIGAAMLGQVVAGGAGLLQLAKGDGLDEATQAIEDVQGAAAQMSAPKTQAGTKGLQNVTDLIQLGVDVTQYSMSGLGGIMELVRGESVEQAARTVQDVQTKGVAATAGDRVFEETGSPLQATGAYMFPELVASAIPIINMGKKASRYQTAVAARLRDSQAQPEVARGIADLNARIQSGEITGDLYPAFDRLIQASTPRLQNQLVQAADDVRLGADPQSVVNKLNQVEGDAARAAADTSIVDYVRAGSNGIKTDFLARGAIRQGFDQGVIASVKASSPLDRSRMVEMMDILEKGKADALYAVVNRPSDVAGNSLLQRVNYIKDINRQAGSELDGIAQDLRGQTVDYSSVVNSFVTRLDDIGVKMDNDLKPIFEGSDIEGVVPAQNAINNVINRMKSGDGPDAYDLHRMKKFIDEQVTYGKASEGLAGKTENILKGLRRDLDSTLDTNFPEYNRVNTAYSDTVGALDTLQSSVGKKMDLFGDNADRAVGTVLRRLMSNAQSRINILDSVQDIESVTRKYGGEFDDNIQVQMLFADELDSVFGPVARTGFQRSVGEGVKYGVEAATGQKTGIGMLAEAAGAMTNKARGINNENAFKAIRKLLERP